MLLVFISSFCSEFACNAAAALAGGKAGAGPEF